MWEMDIGLFCHVIVSMWQKNTIEYEGQKQYKQQALQCIVVASNLDNEFRVMECILQQYRDWNNTNVYQSRKTVAGLMW